MPIRLVTFDALFTLVRPRQPVYVQYAQVFAPHLGALPPETIQRSFKSALKALQAERPAYAAGAAEWWAEAIRRTAAGAGADPAALERALPEIVPTLLHRFSSKEGYAFYDDAVPTIRALQRAGVQVGLITNADARMRAVLASLAASRADGDGAPLELAPVIVSEELGCEKPATRVFRAALVRAGVYAAEALHVGDEYRADYRGARDAGMHALLLRRPGAEDGTQGPGEGLPPSAVIEGLGGVVDVVQRLS